MPNSFVTVGPVLSPWCLDDIFSSKWLKVSFPKVVPKRLFLEEIFLESLVPWISTCQLSQSWFALFYNDALGY